MNRIHVQYYAVLREQAGTSDEILMSAATTPADLYQELQTRHGFSLAPELLRVAINDEFCEWSRRESARLAEGGS